MLDKDYVTRKEGWLNSEHHPFSLVEGEEIEIYSSNKLLYGTDLTGNVFPNFIQEAAKHIGQTVQYSCFKGVLVGISYTYTDWYYMIQHPKGLMKCSCTGNIKFAEEKFGNVENLT